MVVVEVGDLVSYGKVKGRVLAKVPDPLHHELIVIKVTSKNVGWMELHIPHDNPFLTKRPRRNRK